MGELGSMGGLLAEWLPAATAAATLVAACLAFVAALVVALVNARAARQLALDAAHREYRTALARRVLQGSRSVYRILELCEKAVLDVDVTGLRRLYARFGTDRLDEFPIMIDLPFAQTFWEAQINYHALRSKAKKAIAEILERDPSTWDVDPLIEQRFAMANAFGVLELAAQGFIFRLHKPSRFASHILSMQLA